MIIVEEGHDLCGKDTRIYRFRAMSKELSEVPAGPRGATAILHNHWDQIIRAKKSVFNRGFLSEFVYAAFHEREDQLTNEDLYFISLLYDTYGAVLDVQISDVHELRRRYFMRGDSELSIEQVEQIRAVYLSACSQNGCRI